MNEQKVLELFLKYALVGLVYFIFSFINTKHDTKVFFSTGVLGFTVLLLNIIFACFIWPAYLIVDIVKIIKGSLI